MRLAIKALELVMKLWPSASLPCANVSTCTFLFASFKVILSFFESGISSDRLSLA